MSSTQQRFEIVCIQRAPAQSIFASIADIRGNTLYQAGDANKIANLWSGTKSFFGLCVAHEAMNNQFDVCQDVTDMIRVICRNAEIKEGERVRFCDLLCHTSGISDLPLKNLSDVIEFLTTRRSTHGRLSYYVKSISTECQFSYSPMLGFMLAGAIFELLMRKKTNDDSFSLRVYCEKLFFPSSIKGQWEWSVCEGLDICNHTMAHAELKMTGWAMKEVCVNLLSNHRKLLEYIITPKQDGSYVRHARSRSASGGDVDETTVGNNGKAEILIDYDYSMGWWIIPNDKIITGVGLGGQYLTLDLKQDIVGVRQQSDIISRRRVTSVEYELLFKKTSLILNSHETFPLLVRDILKSDVDPNLERKHMFSLDDFDMYWKLCHIVDGKGMFFLSDVGTKILSDALQLYSSQKQRQTTTFKSQVEKQALIQAFILDLMIKLKESMPNELKL